VVEENMEHYMTIGEAGTYIRTPVETLRKWRTQGTGPKAARIGKRLLYRRSELDRWVKSRERERA
jgi:excisionase family DNA binding protein